MAAGRNPIQTASPPARGLGFACSDRGPGRSCGSLAAIRTRTASVNAAVAAASPAMSQGDSGVKATLSAFRKDGGRAASPDSFARRGPGPDGKSRQNGPNASRVVSDAVELPFYPSRSLL